MPHYVAHGEKSGQGMTLIYNCQHRQDKIPVSRIKLLKIVMCSAQCVRQMNDEDNGCYDVLN